MNTGRQEEATSTYLHQATKKGNNQKIYQSKYE